MRVFRRKPKHLRELITATPSSDKWLASSRPLVLWYCQVDEADVLRKTFFNQISQEGIMFRRFCLNRILLQLVAFANAFNIAGKNLYTHENAQRNAVLAKRISTSPSTVKTQRDDGL